MATADHVQRGLSAGRIRSDRVIDLAYRLRAFGIVAALALLLRLLRRKKPAGQRSPLLRVDFDISTILLLRVSSSTRDQVARAAASLVDRLLPVLDALDLATDHLGDNDSDAAKALVAAALGPPENLAGTRPGHHRAGHRHDDPRRVGRDAQDHRDHLRRS